MQYTKGKLLIDGGEGCIHEVAEDSGLLMKIYKDTDSLGEPVVTPELTNKLRFMIENPPEVLIEKGIIAWPLEAVTDPLLGGASQLTGFIMPRLDMNEHLQRVYSYRHPQLDAAEYSKFPSVKSRIAIAINLCSALNELHRAGYVVGDFNHRNIGVNYNTGQIYFVDCDSFHITDADENVYRSNVIMAGYLAPEIIRHCNKERDEGREYNLDKVSLPTFTKESDLFCLAIHIFKLLMNGVDPYRGVKSDATGSTASPFVGNDAIERDAYVFRSGNRPSAVFCPPMESVPPEIFSLLDKAFILGRSNPKARPDAGKWYHALNRFLTNDLTQCHANAKHQYYRQLTQCPYCAADYRHLSAQGGPDDVNLSAVYVNLSNESSQMKPYGQQSSAFSRQQAPIGQHIAPAFQPSAYAQPLMPGGQAGLSRQSSGFAGQSGRKKSKTPTVITAILSLASIVIVLFLLYGVNDGAPEQAEDMNGTTIMPGEGTGGNDAEEDAPGPAAEVSSIVIQGVEYSTDLTELSLSERGLTDLDIEPLRLMTNLEVLDLGINQIINADAVRGLTNLKVLNLSGNNIFNISFLSGLTRLEQLILCNNNISSIDVLSGLANLTYLHLENNQIVSVSALEGLINLTHLNILTNNPLTDRQINDLISALPDCEVS